MLVLSELLTPSWLTTSGALPSHKYTHNCANCVSGEVFSFLRSYFKEHVLYLAVQNLP